MTSYDESTVRFITSLHTHAQMTSAAINNVGGNLS